MRLLVEDMSLQREVGYRWYRASEKVSAGNWGFNCSDKRGGEMEVWRWGIILARVFPIVSKIMPGSPRAVCQREPVQADASLRTANVDLLLKRGRWADHRPTNDNTHEGDPLPLSDAHSISMTHRQARGIPLMPLSLPLTFLDARCAHHLVSTIVDEPKL